MRKYAVNDLVVYNVNPEHADITQMGMYNNCIVRVIELIEEEFRYWDYFVMFPDNKIIEVHEEELYPAFTW